MTALKASLIVTTYNWPQALSATLGTVAAQSTRDFELILADDGSGPETRQVVEESLAGLNIRWCHVWHPDKGLRKSRINNLAVRHSGARYLIFIDHDVMLHPEFVADHLAGAQEKFFLIGKRSFLPSHLTDLQLSMKSTFIQPSFFTLGLGNRKNALRWPFMGKLLSIPKRFQGSLRGCNLSMFREDFLRVDGYDEFFDQNWGQEDSDLCFRLFHSGLKAKNLWFRALQYHLFHPEDPRRAIEKHRIELAKRRKQKQKLALKGFSTLSGEGGIIASSTDFL